MIIRADARQIPLIDGCVQTCVTSPPYFGLRDYGTARWVGGDADCDHLEMAVGMSDKNTLGPSGYLPPTNAANVGRKRQYRDICGKCGARRIDSQIGLEPSPEAYVASLVAVFAEVWRVLRDDGTVWLNLGDSMSVGSTVLEELQGAMKGVPVFAGNRPSIRVTGQRVGVPLQHDRPPQGELVPLFGVQRVTLKKRNDDLGQVLHLLDGPTHARIGLPIVAMTRHAADLEILLDTVDHVSIVVSELDPDEHSPFGVPSVGATRSREKADAPFAVEQSSEPITKSVGHLQAARDTLACDAAVEGVPDVYLINQAVPFGNAFDAMARPRRDFRVTAASEKHLSLDLGNRGWDLTCHTVGHLLVPDGRGWFARYRQLYSDAISVANERSAKQELGVPFMVRRALMREGWICRSTIIWAKPNPMPESVTDRPTKAHEYIFLLAKSDKYFYDAAAIAEPVSAAMLQEMEQGYDGLGIKDYEAAGVQNPSSVKARIIAAARRKTAGAARREQQGDLTRTTPVGRICGYSETLTRNRRTVWTVNTQPYAGSHFATFPEKLIEPCILAGAPLGGLVLDPFCGSGTTIAVAQRLGRRGVGTDLSYQQLARERTAQRGIPFSAA